MQNPKYVVNQVLVSSILNWVISGQIAIPEIQRPFVWSASKVRDLLDSLYQGFPIGYVIAWKNPDAKLKDGSTAEGKKVLIDGQQRVVALTAAVLGREVVNKDYKKIRIKIAFNPLEEKFEVINPAIEKDIRWIPDISVIMKGDADLFEIAADYLIKNPDADKRKVQNVIIKLKNLSERQIGFIELESDLGIETVTEIFIRINSEGVVLSQADFAMSKIASYGDYGAILRKYIDYFCHLAKFPEFFATLKENDSDFSKSKYITKIEWLKNIQDDLYDPDYSDLLRVAFTSEFNRGKLTDLVSLLSGRNFEKRIFEKNISEESFQRLEKSIDNFTNQTNFERFLMIIKSAGFIDKSMITSSNSINFAYILYLKLKDSKYDPAKIESLVRKWFVLSILTGRYSSSAESAFDYDIRNMAEDYEKYINTTISAELSDSFWEIGLIENLKRSVVSNPFINVFFASQVKENNKGFLSTDITVRDMIIHRGDIHHIFPKAYLRTKYNSRNDYNQIANYVYMQSEINIQVGKKSPEEYFGEIINQIKTGDIKYGGITDMGTLSDNLSQHCIPESIFSMTLDNYFDFLDQRRKLIAQKIKKYYQEL